VCCVFPLKFCIFTETKSCTHLGAKKPSAEKNHPLKSQMIDLKIPEMTAPLMRGRALLHSIAGSTTDNQT